MRNWLGLALFALGVWFAWSGLMQRRRVRAAGPRGGPDESVPTHPSLAMLRDVVPSMTIAFLAFVALKATLMYWALGGSRLISPFDLAGFLCLLAGYGTWLHCKSRYRELAPTPPVAADPGGPADDELERADLPRDGAGAGRRARAGVLAAGRPAARTAAPRAGAARRRSA
jgi:hypothetical protein